MCKKAENPRRALPKLALLVLYLCAGSLVAHVAADGLKQPGYNQSEIEMSHHHWNDGDDHEESLYLSAFGGVQSSPNINHSRSSARLVNLSRAILPIIPPPKA
jgi:hypothetical protein